jgi:hypothetical protein
VQEARTKPNYAPCVVLGPAVLPLLALPHCRLECVCSRARVCVCVCACKDYGIRRKPLDFSELEEMDDSW